MNTVSMTGTLTKDPELKSGGETKVCRMRLGELNGGDSKLFVNVAAFGRQADELRQAPRQGPPRRGQRPAADARVGGRGVRRQADRIQHLR